MLINGIEMNVLLGTMLVSLYAKCGSFEDARLVFDKIPKPNVFSWNALIRGYAMYGLHEEVLRLYCKMQNSGVKPDNFTFPFVLKACADLAHLQQGKGIHGCIIRSGFEWDVYVANGLVAMYARCGSLKNARQVFDKMSQRDVVSWNTMIAGYAQNGNCDQALKLFGQNHRENAKHDSVTIVSVLPACAHLAGLEQGKQIHGCIIRSGFELDVFVGSALVDMYAKCGNLEFAREAFDKMSQKNGVSWGVMISGYAQNGHEKEALKLFRETQMAGVKTNSDTIASVLSGCAHLAALQQGKEIHQHILRSGLELDVFVGSALIDMYAKSKGLESARQVFNCMSQRNVTSWNAITAGYAQCGHADIALKLFRQMQPAGVTPDSVTIATVLPACAHLATLQLGKEIHDYVIRSGLESVVFVGNAVIDMYAKCGSIESAGQVFDRMSERDLISWNAIIVGYGMHGHGVDALRYLYKMQQAGTMPDHITFIGVLSACSHAGLVDEGWKYFNLMSEDYRITPAVEHYACMVDLLGRAGQLDEAHTLIKNMALLPGADVWGALLGACRIHCNVDLGESVAKHLFKLEPENEGNYVLLSNIYAESGQWSKVAKVRTLMKDKGLIKRAGCSWIEVDNGDHAFFVGDKSHPRSDEIYVMLETLALQMKDSGYVANTYSLCAA